MSDAATLELKPVKYDMTTASLDEMRGRLTNLPCTNAKEYDLVRRGIAETRKWRGDVEQMRKSLKADALEYGKQVDSEAKRITAMLLEIESPLQAAKDAYDAEREKERQAKIQAERQRIEAELAAKRAAEEAKLKAARDAEEARLKAIRDEEEKRLAAERERLEAERKKLEAEQAAERERQRIEKEKRDAEEAAKRKAEDERLAAERKALEEEQARQREAQRKIDEANAAEQKRLDDERRAFEAEKQKQERAEFERQAKIKAEREAKELAERQRRFEAEEAERRAIDEENRKAAIKAEEARIEALKPDAEKLADWAARIKSVSPPDVQSEEAGELVVASLEMIDNIVADLLNWKAMEPAIAA